MDNMAFYIVFWAVIAYVVFKILADLIKWVIFILIFLLLMYVISGKDISAIPTIYTTTEESTITNDPVSHDDFVGQWVSANRVIYIFKADRTLQIGNYVDGNWFIRQHCYLHINLHGIRENLLVVSVSKSKIVLQRADTRKPDIILFR